MALAASEPYRGSCRVGHTSLLAHDARREEQTALVCCVRIREFFFQTFSGQVRYERPESTQGSVELRTT